MQKPVVSVIIPNYNHARFLEQRLKSVLHQTFTDFEIIILDDHSVDNSRDVIERFRGNEKVSKIIYNEVNSGSPFKQWQRGVEAAQADLIWIAESDDFAEPDFLEQLIKPFFNYPDVVLSYCRSIDVEESGEIIGTNLHADQLDTAKWQADYIEPGKLELRNYLRYRNIIPNASAVVFKKSPVIDWKRYTTMKFCGDWLFWKDLVAGGRVSYNHRSLNCFRTHAETTRFLSQSINLTKELIRFKEYRQLVHSGYLNPFDERYRWMMAEWIDRGLPNAFAHGRYHYFPLLHPALIVRYYLYQLKSFFKNIRFGIVRTTKTVDHATSYLK